MAWDVCPPSGPAALQGSPPKLDFADDFDYYTIHYKVDACTLRVPHDWAACPFAHKQGGERSARRDLRRFPYLSIPCDYAKQKRPCPKGDYCPHAHSLYEYWLHPDRFRTEVCQYGLACKRPVCFFAHTPEQLRTPDPSLPPAELCWQTGACLRFGRNKIGAAGGGSGNSNSHGTLHGGGGGGGNDGQQWAADRRVRRRPSDGGTPPRGPRPAFPAPAACGAAAALQAPSLAAAGFGAAQLPFGLGLGLGGSCAAGLTDLAAFPPPLPTGLLSSLQSAHPTPAASAALSDHALAALLIAHAQAQQRQQQQQQQQQQHHHLHQQQQQAAATGVSTWGLVGAAPPPWPESPVRSASTSPGAAAAAAAALGSPTGSASPSSSSDARGSPLSAAMAGAGGGAPQVVFLVVPQSALDSAISAVGASGLPVSQITQLLLPPGACGGGSGVAAAGVPAAQYACAGGVAQYASSNTSSGRRSSGSAAHA